MAEDMCVWIENGVPCVAMRRKDSKYCAVHHRMWLDAVGDSDVAPAQFVFDPPLLKDGGPDDR